MLCYAAIAQLGASAFDNTLSELAITGNQIIENLDVGILTSTTQPFDSGPTGRNAIENVLVQGNTLSALVVRDSDIAATKPVVVFGGTMNQTEDTIRASTVSDVRLENNTIHGSQPPVLGGGVVVGSGAVRDCQVGGVRLIGNVDAAGSDVKPIVFGQAATGALPRRASAATRSPM